MANMATQVIGHGDHGDDESLISADMYTYAYTYMYISATNVFATRGS